MPKIRLEIAVNDTFVERTINTIVRAAKHSNGERGDGKIIIVPIEDCVRISTGERGGDAI